MTAEEWLTQVRALDLENLDRLGVRWGPVKNASGEAIAFPYRRNGETVATKLRGVGSRETLQVPFWWSPKGGANGLLFNEDTLRDETLSDLPVIITEGEMDCLTVIECGKVRAVSIPDGWSGEAREDNSKCTGLLRNKAAIQNAPSVIIAGDNDEVGNSFVQACYNIFDKVPVRYVTWPTGCKDANETLQKHGHKAVVEAIEAAKPIKPVGGMITGFTDAPPAPAGRVYSTGIDTVDKVLCFHEGFPTVVTGIPESGKSTFITWALHMTQKRHKIRNAVALMETPWTVLEDHLSRLYTGKSIKAVADRDALRTQLDENWRLLHTDDDEAGGMEWVRNMIRSASVDHGASIVTFDPWNEIEHRRLPGENETEYTNAALAKVRQWSERYGVAVCLIAHPTKMQDSAGGKPKTPLGYDISGSSAWYNKAAVGLTVHRNDEDQPELINWKSKFHQLYPCRRGKQTMTFDPQQMVYRRAM